MESFTYALWGVAFGVALSAPVGPINIICLRRALFGKASDGFLIGLGAAAGDTFYAILAAFGLKAVFSFIELYITPLKLLSSMVMVVFAIYIWRSNPRLKKDHEVGKVKRTVF
ncbi:MAG: LysE family translocator, partial [Kordiimonas sp.]